MGLTGEQILQEINDTQRISLREFPRTYLGMSSLGKPCARAIWFDWRWISPQQFTPRLKRLFGRGHREEEQFVDMLRLIGFKVWEKDPKTGKQFEFLSSEGHCRGHCDATAFRDKILYLVEMKTHNQQSFLSTKKGSIQTTKAEHYCQTQRYMHEVGAGKYIYGAVNKNDDSLHFEVGKENPTIIQWLKEREKELIGTTAPPAKIAETPTFWICNMCWYQDICFGDELPLKNCRTCSKSALGLKGSWLCQRKGKKARKSPSEQLMGCQHHQYI